MRNFNFNFNFNFNSDTVKFNINHNVKFYFNFKYAPFCFSPKAATVQKDMPSPYEVELEYSAMLSPLQRSRLGIHTGGLEQAVRLHSDIISIY